MNTRTWALTLSLTCVGCGYATAAASTSRSAEVARRAVLAQATARGWSLHPKARNRDYCPACANPEADHM